MKKSPFVGHNLSRVFLVWSILVIIVLTVTMIFLVFKERSVTKSNQSLKSEIVSANAQIASLSASLAVLKEENDQLMKEDLRVTNKKVQEEMSKLKAAYLATKEVYVDLIEIRGKTTKTGSFDSSFASILGFLAQDDLDKAIAGAKKLSEEIAKEITKLASSTLIPASVPENNVAPSSGYQKQKVSVNGVYYLVDIVAADLGSTKVIVDTASESTCANDCPVLPLATYVSRNNAFAGINGTYFCPDTYPDCASKKNSFDVLVMNKNKVYFNSDNNVYSTVPVAVFSGSSARFIPQTKDWGRDTGVDAVIANRPLLVYNGNNMFAGGGEVKEGIKSNRSFLGSSGSTVYIGVVRSATVAEAAAVLTTMGVKNAINLDSGGSTALWSGGYRVGPGRNLPNVVLLVKK